MNILGLLKKKYNKEIEQLDEDKRRRRQLNMIVDARLIDEVKRLAAWFETPRYVIVEHALDVACFYLTKTLKNPSKYRRFAGIKGTIISLLDSIVKDHSGCFGG